MTTAQLTKVGGATNVIPAIRETITKAGNWFGRTVTHTGQSIKSFFKNAGSAVAQFFKNFPAHVKKTPTYLNTGFGLGGIGIVAGATTAVVGGTFAKNKVARALLTVGGVAVAVASAIFMMVFKGNPVFVSRAAAV